MTVQYIHLTYEDYKSLEQQMKRWDEIETAHKSTGGFYHKSVRVKIGSDLIMEFHGPLVGGYGHDDVDQFVTGAANPVERVDTYEEAVDISTRLGPMIGKDAPSNVGKNAQEDKDLEAAFFPSTVDRVVQVLKVNPTPTPPKAQTEQEEWYAERKRPSRRPQYFKDAYPPNHMK